MKTAPILFICFLMVLSGCKQPAVVTLNNAFDQPSFNQVNTVFESAHVQCLLNQWYGRKYQNEPIVFRVINDASTYATFFSCSPPTSLPTIDFTSSSLLVGMKADYAQFIDSPVNINTMEQKLVATSNGTYTLQVKVTGKASTDRKGGEWFAFTSVVPKISSTVNLDIQYQYK